LFNQAIDQKISANCLVKAASKLMILGKAYTIKII